MHTSLAFRDASIECTNSVLSERVPARTAMWRHNSPASNNPSENPPASGRQSHSAGACLVTWASAKVPIGLTYRDCWGPFEWEVGNPGYDEASRLECRSLEDPEARRGEDQSLGAWKPWLKSIRYLQIN